MPFKGSGLPEEENNLFLCDNLALELWAQFYPEKQLIQEGACSMFPLWEVSSDTCWGNHYLSSLCSFLQVGSTLVSSFVGKMSPGVVLTRSVHGRDQRGCQAQGLAEWRVFWLWLQTFKSCWLRISLKPACVYPPSLFPLLFNPKTAVHC